MLAFVLVVRALCMLGGANAQFGICLAGGGELWSDVCRSTLRLFSGHLSALLPSLSLFTGLVASSHDQTRQE